MNFSVALDAKEVTQFCGMLLFEYKYIEIHEIRSYKNRNIMPSLGL